MSEPRGKKPQRTLERVTQLATGATITSDQLLTADPDRYQAIRRAATAARREKKAAFVCEQCGYAVYAPLEPSRRLPFWRHNKGAPRDCPWWTGDPSPVDTHSAAQFQGAQESPLHHWLKYQVGETLMLDPLTAPGSVLIDEYLNTSSGRRRPDVRAVHSERKLAFEIPLSSTQLPIIDGREHFYQQEGYHLLWLTWKFQPVPRRLMVQSFVDIFYSHNKNLFSLDDEVLARSRAEGRFLVRAYWETGRNWASEVFSLTDLIWPLWGLPYAAADWNVGFLLRWQDAIKDGRLPFEARRALLMEIIEELGLSESTWQSFDALDIPTLINLLLSLVHARPIGTKQRNLVEMLNTFFHLADRQPYARLVCRFAKVTGHVAALEKNSVALKIEAAMAVPQAGQMSIAGQVAWALFPDVLLRSQS